MSSGQPFIYDNVVHQDYQARCSHAATLYRACSGHSSEDCNPADAPYSRDTPEQRLATKVDGDVDCSSGNCSLAIMPLRIRPFPGFPRILVHSPNIKSLLCLQYALSYRHRVRPSTFPAWVNLGSHAALSISWSALLATSFSTLFCIV